MASREFLYLVKESSYGVPMATPTLGTDAFYIRLEDGNAFDMVCDPVQTTGMYGGGRATPAYIVSDSATCQGALKTQLYAGALSKFLCDWGLTVINTGRTTPWTTTDANTVMPVGDLASVSCYHAIQYNDGTYDRRLHNGVKVLGGSIAVSRSSPKATLSLNLQGIRDDTNAAGTVAFPDATEFPPPAETSYPSNPYLFSHTATKLKIAATITQYDSVGVSWTNAMDPKWFESKFVQMIRFLGRNSTMTAGLHLKVSPDKRAAFRALTAQDTELTFDNGTNTLKLDFNTQNIISKLPYDLPLDKVFMQNLTLQNLWDSSLGTDITVTST